MADAWPGHAALGASTANSASGLGLGPGCGPGPASVSASNASMLGNLFAARTPSSRSRRAECHERAPRQVVMTLRDDQFGRFIETLSPEKGAGGQLGLGLGVMNGNRNGNRNGDGTGIGNGTENGTGNGNRTRAGKGTENGNRTGIGNGNGNGTGKGTGNRTGTGKGTGNRIEITARPSAAALARTASYTTHPFPDPKPALSAHRPVVPFPAAADNTSMRDPSSSAFSSLSRRECGVRARSGPAVGIRPRKEGRAMEAARAKAEFGGGGGVGGGGQAEAGSAVGMRQERGEKRRRVVVESGGGESGEVSPLKKMPRGRGTRG